MKLNNRKSALSSISIGLIGISAYQIILRVSPTAALGNDLLHGIWFGVCFGLEIVGIILLNK